MSLDPTVNSGKVPGRVLPLCWANICAAILTPFFDLLRIEHNLFGVLFLIHQHQKAHFGYQSFQNYIFLTPNSTLPRSFRVQFSAARGTPPPVSRPSTSQTLHPHPLPHQSPTHPTVVKSVTCGCLSINQSNPVLLKERVRIPERAVPEAQPCSEKAPVRRGRLLLTVLHRWSPRQSILSAGLR